MSYIGRVSIRVLKEGKELEFLDHQFSPSREWRRKGGAAIEECGIEHCGPILVEEILKGRADGVHDIEGRYVEEWHQDYEGEWDSQFWLENERVKFCGQLLEN